MYTRAPELGWIAYAALYGATLLSVPVIWFISLRRRRTGPYHVQVVKFAHVLVNATLPVFAISIALAIVLPGIEIARASAPYRGTHGIWIKLSNVSRYTGLTSWLLGTGADICLTWALDLVVLALVYLAYYGREKWWKESRLIGIYVASLFHIVALVYYAVKIHHARMDQTAKPAWQWLPRLLLLALFKSAIGLVIAAIALWRKFKKNPHLKVGKIPALFLSASVIWLFRWTFVFALEIRCIVPNWTSEEIQAQNILGPVFGSWTTAAVFGLLVAILRHELWSNRIDNPESSVPDCTVQSSFC